MNKIYKFKYTKEMKMHDWGEARASYGGFTDKCYECTKEKKVGDLIIDSGNDSILICWECFNSQYRVGMECYDE